MKRYIYVIFLLFLFLISADSQWLQTNGPYGGNIRCFAVSGTNTFAGTQGGGVFLSANNGGNWSAVNNGLTSRMVYSLFANGTNLFAGTYGGIFLSTNNGSSWTGVNNGIPSPEYKVFKYLTASGTNLFAASDGYGIFLSTNNGGAWSAVNNGLTNLQVQSIAIIGTNLFAGTFGGGIFLSTNNGGSWTGVNNGLTNLMVSSLAVIGTNIFAGTTGGGGGGVFLSTNNGSSWSAVSNGLPELFIQTLLSSGSNLFAGTFNCGIFLSTNNGANWNPANNGFLLQPVNTLFANGSYLYTGCGPGGIFLSTNNGGSWTAANNGLLIQDVYSLFPNGNNMLAGNYGGGIYASSDYGTNWSALNNGLTNGRVQAVNSCQSALFAGTLNGVFRSVNNGANWTEVLSAPYIYALTSAGNNIFAGSYTSGVYLSTNNGTNWNAVNNGLTNQSVLSLASIGANLFAGVTGGVYKSTNDGAIWTYTGWSTGYYIKSLGVMGTDLYAGCDNGGYIYRSTNYGGSWTNVSNGLPSQNAVYAFAAVGTNLFIGNDLGVFYTSNNGSNWVNVNQGFGSDMIVRSLTVLNERIFAGTDGHSVWRRNLSDIFPPGVPILQSPPNNSINIPVNFNLIWLRPQFAVSYHLQLAADSLFNNLIINDSTISDTLRVVNGLSYITNYWWRVRAKNPAGSGSFSTVFKFTTSVAPPAPPVLISPANNSTNQSLTPKMDWSASSGASSYRIQISSDSAFATTVVDSTLSVDSLTVPAGKLQLWIKYYWHVRASNTGGNSSYSVVWNFTPGIVDIKNNGAEIPKEYKLYNNYPNPFNPVTKIKFDIPAFDKKLSASGGIAVRVSIYDVLGKEVGVLVNQQMEPRKYNIEWNASNYPSGVYYYRMIAGDYTETKKMVLIK